MGFLAPWFLAGLAALGLPVFLHLLRRHTTVPRPVSSLMFFEKGTQSSVKHRRLRYLLLFTLRALLVLLLVLAFANPFIRRATVSASDRLLLVVVDNSFSMNASEGAGTKLDAAKKAALAVLAQRSGSQRAQVIVLGGVMQVLTQPIQDAGALKAAVDGIEPGDAHGNFGELGRGMRAMAETVHTPMELHLFSDMQTSNMPANFADMVMPGNVALTLHPVGKASPNWTVESVQAPGQLVDPKKARVLAVIAGHETPAAQRTVSADGERDGGRDAQGGCAREWTGDGGVRVAGCPLWREPVRGTDRFRGQLQGGRCQQLRGEAGRPGACAVRPPGDGYAVAAVLRCGAGRGGAGVVRAAVDYARPGRRFRPVEIRVHCPVGRVVPAVDPREQPAAQRGERRERAGRYGDGGFAPRAHSCVWRQRLRREVLWPLGRLCVGGRGRRLVPRR